MKMIKLSSLALDLHHIQFKIKWDSHDELKYFVSLINRYIPPQNRTYVYNEYMWLVDLTQIPRLDNLIANCSLDRCIDLVSSDYWVVSSDYWNKWNKDTIDDILKNIYD